MNEQSTIELEVRYIGSPDVEFDSWEPSSFQDIYFLVEIEIGQKRTEGADIFQVVIATPEALRLRANKMLIAERSTIVIASYDWSKIESIIHEIVRKCQADTWVASVLRLQRFFHWEYEDYQVEADS